MISSVRAAILYLGVLSSCLSLINGFTISPTTKVVVAPHHCNHHDGRSHHYRNLRSSSCRIPLTRNGIAKSHEDQEDHEELKDNIDNNNDDHNPIFGCNRQLSINRRTVVQSLLTSTTTILYNNGSFASGRAMGNNSLSSTIISSENDDKKKAMNAMPNLQCLMDLPPSTSNDDGLYDVVRIYLCRHGQTEYNRLHLVQGARVDPPLNDTGKRMAYRLGRALSNLPPADTRTLQLGAHSYLQRAQQTAQLASQSLSFGASSSNKEETEYEFIDAAMTGGSSSRAATAVHPLLKLEALPELGEVDFGPGNEGKPAAEVRGDMYTTFGAWAIGRIDTRPRDGEGETGREVLNRASLALTNLALMASKNGGSIMAVSHSFYIRMLLSMVMEIPLAQAVTLEQKNGCVNILDIPIRKKDGQIQTKTLGPKSKIFGPAPLAPSDFKLTIPEVKVIRLNENRHLTDLI